MKVIGLTGGIASGVTLVAGMFRELGAAVIEADQVSREVVRPGTETYRAVVDAFGPALVTADGTLDRPRLARIIFQDPAARVRLNALTHPAIRRRIWERIEEIRRADPEAVVIVDIPLLLDTSGPETFDLDGVIVVTASPELQLSRAMQRDGLIREEAQRRLDAQRPVALKAAEADWVIDNTGTIENTRRQVRDLWDALRRKDAGRISTVQGTERRPVMEKVRSNDGTPVAYERSGHGPPLVLVHGTTADHTRWAAVLGGLEKHFTVWAMDRRGRGESGDTEPYALEREFEDVAAVVSAAGPRANLLGHSYGALCAMEAALQSPNLHKLVLYEPPFPVEGIQSYPPGAKERFQALLDQGDRDLLLVTFFREFVQVPEEQIALLRAEPAWQARLAAAHTVVREFADADYVFDPERFRRLAVPTLLLLGEASPPALKKPTERLAAVLPNSRLAVLPGQGHFAMRTAPELFLREVVGFLRE